MPDRVRQTDEALASGMPDGLPLPRRATKPGNLPLPLTSFVGRAEALAAVLQLLSTTRLLTLTGPGGVGKTRLALEVASRVQTRFQDGLCWVELASLCEGHLVAHEVAQVLGLPDDPGQSRLAGIGDYLKDGDFLLVLDNCEHLVIACAELAGHLLQACPRLRILSTSRELLGIGGETIWSVPPLSLPCLEVTPTLDSLALSEAGQLFLQRALAVLPNLEMTENTIRAMTQICCRLDGIPLAIELAAARVRVISVVQIATRLDDRFRLLTGGSRLDLPHHQTLGATLQWSYDLLERPEQTLFERLAVFVGGFRLEAAEAVAGDPAGPEAIQPVEVLDLLSRLVQKSLVDVVEGDQVRYRMLETIRQYALERLRASGGLEPVRRRHLAYYLELAWAAELRLMGAEQLEALRLLEVEHDNLRAALSWSQESQASDAALRLATSLAAFWLRVGYLTEGSGWLQRALDACREPGAVRIQALYQAGRLAQQRGAYAEALDQARQSLALSSHLDDRRGMARARGLMGWVAHWRGDRDSALPLLEEALTLARESGDERTIALTLLLLGDLRLRVGAHEQAVSLLQESLELYQEMEDGWSTAWALGALGDVARLQGDHQQAVARLQSSLSLYRELDSKPEIPFPLEALALMAADQGHFVRAAHLLAAASAVRASIHAHLPPSYEADYAPTLKQARAALGDEAFAAAWAEGQALTLDQALAMAIAEPPSALPLVEAEAPPKPATARSYGLTPRELDVLRLVANGLTDAQIAEQLVISPRTVGKHLQSIYSKLYLPSRSAATRWAIEHHLA
jgi:predicted ATPase/DNA-binding NarL/FixJ family response regulator